jgi:gluconate:H+ symporter, GntP family
MFILTCLVATLIGIILAITWLKLHPFLVLLVAGLVMGFAGGLGPEPVLTALTEGFGNTLKSIGIVIACGTIIGTFLERSGAARTLATSILKKVGQKRAPLAMNLTGFIVSIPVFCDSGFVILAALNRVLSRKTGISLAVLSVALATGLYTTHVFVPPTPGPLAAAAALDADLGLVMLLGLVVAVPTGLVGWLWALFYCKRFGSIVQDAHDEPVPAPVPEIAEEPSPPLVLSLAPLFIPIVLIALRSVATYPTAPLGEGLIKQALVFVGHPIIALLGGVFLCFGLKTRQMNDTALDWVAAGLKQAGVIILITGAGGAFGNILRATQIGDILGQTLVEWKLGIMLPFLMAAFLKTAQGSSTVAIITTAALVSPLLGALGLTTAVAKALAVLAIGAGAMTVSHVNDSYFWVVSQFSDMDTGTALRCFSLATLWQGLAGIATVVVLAQVFA